MFEAKQALFIYCVSTVHMGAGTALGPIDNPIQREVHTQHPLMAGSGLKGAIRHALSRDWDKELIKRLFGPLENPDFAGAISFTDAKIVAFPVRSLKNAFVYATSPVALGGLKRFAALAGMDADWDVPTVQTGQCFMAAKNAASNGKLVLEAFEFEVQGGTVKASQNGLPIPHCPLLKNMTSSATRSKPTWWCCPTMIFPILSTMPPWLNPMFASVTNPARRRTAGCSTPKTSRRNLFSSLWQWHRWNVIRKTTSRINGWTRLRTC